jgi:hypothetical protein
MSVWQGVAMDSLKEFKARHALPFYTLRPSSTPWIPNAVRQWMGTNPYSRVSGDLGDEDVGRQDSRGRQTFVKLKDAMGIVVGPDGDQTRRLVGVDGRAYGKQHGVNRK